jgi:hypothetical protein
MEQELGNLLLWMQQTPPRKRNWKLAQKRLAAILIVKARKDKAT